MKKLLAVALGALAISATANANWYVQGDLGYSNVRISGDGDTDNKRVFTPSIAVGYKFADWRLALDYTHFGTMKWNDSWTDNGVSYEDEWKLKIRSFGFSALYDFNLNSPITPYVGAKLTLNYLNGKGHELNQTSAGITSSYDSKKSTKVGAGVLAGVSYKLTQDLYLNANVEYNYLGKDDEDNIHQYGAKVGLRYEF